MLFIPLRVFFLLLQILNCGCDFPLLETNILYGIPYTIIQTISINIPTSQKHCQSFFECVADCQGMQMLVKTRANIIYTIFHVYIYIYIGLDKTKTNHTLNCVIAIFLFFQIYFIHWRSFNSFLDQTHK